MNLCFNSCKQKKHKKAITQSLKEGVVYIKNHKVIFNVVIFSFIMIAIGLPYTTLLPVFAKDYFHIGAAGYGYLFSVVGIGALLGSLFSGIRSKEKVKFAMISSFILFSVLLILFGSFARTLSNHLSIFIIILLLIGFCFATFNITNNTIIQLQVSEVFRGRVLSTLSLGFGFTSLGNFIIGWLAQSFSAPWAYIIIGSVLLMLSMFLVYFTRDHQMHA